jgi:DNA-binding CsgD family transcriptional regulator
VSWRPVESLLEAARRAQIDTLRLLDGLPFDEKSLRPLGWIDWSHFCTLAERIESAVGGPERMLTLADSLPLMTVRAAAPAFVAARQLYKMIGQVVIPMILPALELEYQELTDGRLRIAWKIRSGARASLAVQRMGIGSVRSMPAYLGQSPGTLEVSYDERSAEIFVTLPAEEAVPVSHPAARVQTAELVEILSALVQESDPPWQRFSNLVAKAERLDDFARRHGLTARQARVLHGVVDGLANKEIAARLQCAENTVELHVSNLFKRLAVNSRTQLVSRFWQA